MNTRLLFVALAVAGSSGASVAVATTRATVTASAASSCPTGDVTPNGVCTHGATTTTPFTRGWLLRCNFSHTLGDDPIRFPAKAGQSHLHDFFGNSTTNATSTYASMTNPANRGLTACAPSSYSGGTSADTAAYWNPQVILNGVQPVNPTQTSQQIYYRYRYAAGTVVEAFPPDLRVVVGNSKATSIATNPALVAGNIFWECQGNTSKHYQTPPSCAGGEVLENTVLPSCWDGVLTHVDDTAHMAYRPDMGTCPTGFPHALPQVSIKIKYLVGKDGSKVSLSSGPAYTAHSDFWNTWQQSGLQYLVDKCLNGNQSCGTNPLTP